MQCTDFSIIDWLVVVKVYKNVFGMKLEYMLSRKKHFKGTTNMVFFIQDQIFSLSASTFFEQNLQIWFIVQHRIRLTFVPEPFAATLSIFLTKNENAKKLQIDSSQLLYFLLFENLLYGYQKSLNRIVVFLKSSMNSLIKAYFFR